MSEPRPKAPLPIFDVKKWTYRMVIASAFAVAVLVLARPWDHPYLLLPGGILAALGCLLRIWGTGHLRKNKVLATGGPYAHVRHPLYLGTFLVMLGLALMSGSEIVILGLLPVGVLIFLVYYAPKKERRESDRLRRIFGEEFDRYHAAVRGYLPRITPYPHRQGRWSLEGVIANREYLITVSVLFGAVVILLKYWFVDPSSWLAGPV
jgi:protein-S-isoprenylcysteine O-methyltransferase Ste14